MNVGLVTNVTLVPKEIIAKIARICQSLEDTLFTKSEERSCNSAVMSINFARGFTRNGHVLHSS